MSENHHDDDKTYTHIPLMKDTMVGHYRIIEKIGAGGMGEVYLADDTELDRKVALKFLPPHLCQDDECRARFRRESQAAAKLDHPNIVTVHEVGEYSGRPFFAMQHIEGQSLKERAAIKEFTIEDIVELGIQLCEGLQAAHDKGIAHRDIKPSNILIDSYGRARIVDFGLASVVGKDQLTKTGSTLGTVGYMSPEQIRGQEVDNRTDLFSLGVVLYELITRQNPFKRDSEAATLKAVSDDLAEPLARFKAGLPEGLQAVIDKALEKDVKTRYQHADGMLADLMRIKGSLASGHSSASSPVQVRRSRLNWWIVGALIAVIVVIVFIVFKPWMTDTAQVDQDKIRLVVLPFENLGGQEDEYFADGITDAITSRLARISELGVISRTSAIQYRETEKTLKQIGSELDVGYALEGTILWDKSGDTDRVRIIPQLIRVSDDSHVWAEEYERDLTQIFAVQTDIATSIAEKLNIALLEPEREALAEKPTESTEAYHAYLAAKEEDDDSIKVRMYKLAISLDPGFALAYADLSWHHSSMYQLNIDHTEERLLRAKEAVDSALALQPDLPGAHLALGFYYYCGYREYDKALREYEIAREGLPNQSAVFRVEGWLRRRQGRLEEAVDDFTKAFQLNPRSGFDAYEIGYTCFCLRDYKKALTYIDKAISLEPGYGWNYMIKAAIYILMGDPQSARQLLSYLPSPERAWVMWVYLDFYERNYEEALKYLSLPKEELSRAGSSIWSVNVLRGTVYKLMGQGELARIAFDSARVFLESLEGEDAELVDIQISLAMAYAGLGQKEKAIALGQLAMAKYPYSRDVLEGARCESNMAYIYAFTGEQEAAIDLLEHVMSGPGELESVATLRNFPWWDPLRDNPRFQALIEKYDTTH